MSSPSMTIAPESGRSSWLMQRRNVLLPEPEGPMMQVTSPRETASETSFSAANVPKTLLTPAARTISFMMATSRRRGRSGHPVAPGITLGEIALDEVLADLEQGHDREIPARGDDQELDDAAIRVIDVL